MESKVKEISKDEAKDYIDQVAYMTLKDGTVIIIKEEEVKEKEEEEVVEEKTQEKEPVICEECSVKQKCKYCNPPPQEQVCEICGKNVGKYSNKTFQATIPDNIPQKKIGAEYSEKTFTVQTQQQQSCNISNPKPDHICNPQPQPNCPVCSNDICPICNKKRVAKQSQTQASYCRTVEPAYVQPQQPTSKNIVFQKTMTFGPQFCSQCSQSSQNSQCNQNSQCIQCNQCNQYNQCNQCSQYNQYSQCNQYSQSNQYILSSDDYDDNQDNYKFHEIRGTTASNY